MTLLHLQSDITTAHPFTCVALHAASMHGQARFNTDVMWCVCEVCMKRTHPGRGIKNMARDLRSCSITSLQRAVVLGSVGFQGWCVILMVAFIKENGIIRHHSDNSSRRATQGLPASIILRLRIFKRRSPGGISIFIVVDVVAIIIRILLVSIQVTSLRLHLQGRGIMIVGGKEV